MQNGSQNFLLRLFLSSAAILITSYLLPGVHVENFLSALLLAILLAVFNVTLKPLLIILTIPVTFLTLGLFLLVINALIVLLADAILPGFGVDGFWWALGFSIVLWLINSVLLSIAR
jgi:putative membrane protein